MTALQNWMKHNDWDDGRVASAVNVSRPHINRIRRGGQPSIELAKRLQKLTGVPWHKFFTGKKAGKA